MGARVASLWSALVVPHRLDDGVLRLGADFGLPLAVAPARGGDDAGLLYTSTSLTADEVERLAAFLTRLNLEVLQGELAAGKIPTPLYRFPSVRHVRDRDSDGPQRPERWLGVRAARRAVARRRGPIDCKVASAWRAAELQAAGEPARCRVLSWWVAAEGDPRGALPRYHVVVERAGGSLEDPLEHLPGRRA